MKRLFLSLLWLAAPACSWAQAPRLTQDQILTEFFWDRFHALPKDQRPKLALVLSGGGARAVAHVGVLEALEQEGFDFDVVAGTSMGSMVGALYAAGFTPEQMRTLLPKMATFQARMINALNLAQLFMMNHFVSSQPIETFLHDLIGERRFDQLQRPFGCVATDLNSGEKIIFREGEVAPAVRASMNFPGLFAPVDYRHRQLVDGGVVDYVPVDVGLLLGGQWVLASITEGDVYNERVDNALQTLEQVIDIRGSLLAEDMLRRADIVVRPDAGSIATFDFARVGEAITAGEIAGRRAAPEAERDLVLKTMPALVGAWRSEGPGVTAADPEPSHAAK